MSAKPVFWSQPFRYLRWASHEKPVLFWSFLVGSMGPISVLVVPPIRHRFGDPNRPKVPMTYPSMYISAIISTVCGFRGSIISSRSNLARWSLSRIGSVDCLLCGMMLSLRSQIYVSSFKWENACFVLRKPRTETLGEGRGICLK